MTSIGSVALRVADPARSAAFYVEALGMSELGLDADGARLLGGPDGHVLLSLLGDPDATPRVPHQTGLFHFAVLVPSRADLARALVSVATARVPLTGASDHFVSEALYLRDPDGNGIEIYRDRPRSAWPHDAAGNLEMGTVALDLEDLLAEPAADAEAGGLAAGTVMGHVHLQVASIPEVDRFYTSVIGFDATVRGYPGALFVAAGGYHHHVGLNTWNSRGGRAPGPRSAGSRFFELRVGSVASLDAVLERARVAGHQVEPVGSGFLVHDPADNGVMLTAE